MAMKGQNVTACWLTSGKQRANSGIVIFIRRGTAKERSRANRIQLRKENMKVYNV